MVAGCIAPDEERLALSKLVVQFAFTYGVSRGIFMYVCITYKDILNFKSIKPAGNLNHTRKKKKECFF